MTKVYSIRYSPKALEDLKKIFEYIKFDLLNPASARKQVNRIRKKIYDLKNFPYRYAAVGWEPWYKAEMRKLPVDNYVVYYLVNDDFCEVTIVRVVYCRRNAESILNTEH